MNSPSHILVSNTDMNKSKKTKSKNNQFSTTKAPAAFGVKVKSNVPSVNGSDGIRIKRCEFVGSCTNGAATGYALCGASASIPGYDFNPSCPVLFPWLSRIALAYERFRFESLSFRFVPSQATSTPGRFYAAIDYDYDDAVATSKATLMGNHSSMECAVWQESRLIADPTCLNRDLPFRYVSCTTRGLDVELRTAYSGYLMLAFDTTSANCLMDIWVEYDVRLVTPVTDELIVQDVTPTALNLHPLGALTTAIGTAFANSLQPVYAVSSGPIRNVLPGTETTPQLSWGIGGAALFALYALDIAAAKAAGILNVIGRWVENGVTPSANLVNGNIMALPVYDSTGNYLTRADNASFAHTVLGPVVGTESATATKPVNQLTSLDLHELLAGFPNARYVAPFLYSATNVAGAGNSGYGFHWSA